MLHTHHRVILADSRRLDELEAASVSLVLSSPPYPMIKMWDSIFGELDPEISAQLEAEEGLLAFEAMHACLFETWKECERVLEPGGLMVINIGDATRKIGEFFQLYENHAMILRQARQLGLQILPDILWRKPNNSPTKFLGSGMLPPGAYVTYEHEYILVLRKGGPRRFIGTDRERRRQSAYFWEERNSWFSDLWTGLPGVEQSLGSDDRKKRSRSAAYPLELAWRLIQMFSLHGDTVLDPFLGTGTTMLAAMMSGRNSMGVERDPTLGPTMRQRFDQAVELGRKRNQLRFDAHLEFVQERKRRRTLKYLHAQLDTRVVTSQETDLRLWEPISLQSSGLQRWKMTLDLWEPGPDQA